MAIQAGTRLGPYEIAAQIGAGGMGEVYHARFHREAQALASLIHPNIAAIYGFEDSGTTHPFVMEHAEG
jgi:serine/threonine protein kinase